MNFEHWVVKDSDPLLLQRIQRFQQQVSQRRLNANGHIMFADRGTVSCRHESVEELHDKLMQWYNHQVLHLLSLDVDKDFDPVDQDSLELIQEVRSVFVSYIRKNTSVETMGDWRKAVQFFKVLCMFQPLLVHEQYGLHNVYNATAQKLLQFIESEGVLPMYLLFMELYPTMVTTECHPCCSSNITLEHSQCILDDPILLGFYRKHQTLWDSILPPLLQS